MHALGIFAEQAAFSFEQGNLFGEAEVNLLKIGVADLRRLLRHFLAGDLQALLGGKLVGHGKALGRLLQADATGAAFAGLVGLLLEVAVGGEAVHEQLEVDLVRSKHTGPREIPKHQAVDTQRQRSRSRIQFQAMATSTMFHGSVKRSLAYDPVSTLLLAALHGFL